jgi:hypothetical protein
MQQLNDMIATLRKLGDKKAVAEGVARAVAPLVDDAIKLTARAHETPDGVAWLPRKKDGAPALQHVADQITTKATGLTIRVTLKGPAVFTHFGAGIPKRTVIPDTGGPLPEGVYKACLKGAELALGALARGSQ